MQKKHKRIIKVSKYLLICVFSMFLAVFNASASTYTTTNDLFEGTYSNNLIDMAYNQIDNFINKKFIIFQDDYNYYLVVAAKEDVSVAASSVTLKNSTIFNCYRASGSYGSYTYTSYTESSTTVSISNLVISNIDASNTVGSRRFNDYWSNQYDIWFLMLITALLFAIFLTKGRSYL